MFRGLVAGAIVIVIVLAALVTISQVGERRDPTTGADAAGFVLIYAAVATGVFYLWSSG